MITLFAPNYSLIGINKKNYGGKIKRTTDPSASKQNDEEEFSQTESVVNMLQKEGVNIVRRFVLIGIVNIQTLF